MIDPAEGYPTEDFNVTIEHVDDLGQGSNDIHLLEVPQHDHLIHQFDDILDIGNFTSPCQYCFIALHLVSIAL